MKMKSVGTLVCLALIFIVFRADLGERREVGILRWFGLSIDLQVIKQVFLVLFLNSILFAGEIWQIARGMTDISYTFDLIAFKSLICAPLFEELIYRCCIINMFIESHALTPEMSAILLPFFFAISHLHHIFEQ
jgi:membrane protease YdiL (CAAX protease family)